MFKVSVITPMYNSEKYIASAVGSVRAQTFSDWELIIVDDCSSDSSYEMAVNLAKEDSRIKVYRLDKNSGAAVARNKGIALAEGRYISFLDSDDRWLESKLETQVDFMSRNNVDLCYTGYLVENEDGILIRSVGVPSSTTYNSLLKTCVIGCLTAIYDTKNIGKVYMPLIQKRQDFGLWLKIIKLGASVAGINKPMGIYTQRDSSISSNKGSAARYTWALYRRIEKFNLLTASYYFCHYAIRGLLRYKFPSIAKRLGILLDLD